MTLPPNIEDRLEAAAHRRLELLKLRKCYNPSKPDSRPTPAQQEIIDDFGKIKTQWIVAANRSGKTAYCGRTISWVIQDCHPTWKMPEEWAREGLLIVVGARKSSHIEETVWPSVRNFLDPGTYKEIKVGNILQKVEIDNPKYPDRKHRIIFQSMENVNMARERLQSFDAHISWLDEMVDSVSAMMELQLRVATKGGMFMASFTPLKYSPQVRKRVDSAREPFAKKYKLKTLDNPLFQDPQKRAELLASFEGMPPWEIATRLNGEWAEGEENVYHMEYDELVEMPDQYSPLWRHVLAVDPAISSKLGLTLWAENPKNSIWYCIKAKYISGIHDPIEIFKAVMREVENINVVKRVSDVAPWFTGIASREKVHFSTIHKKADRKDELIKNFQKAFVRQIKFAPDVSDPLIDEIQDCRWSEKTEGKIVNASRFHLIDSGHYFVDMMPPPQKSLPASSWDEFLLKTHEGHKIRAAKEQARRAKRLMIRRNQRRGYSRARTQ